MLDTPGISTGLWKLQVREQGAEKRMLTCESLRSKSMLDTPGISTGLWKLRQERLQAGAHPPVAKCFECRLQLQLCTWAAMTVLLFKLMPWAHPRFQLQTQALSCAPEEQAHVGALLRSNHHRNDSFTKQCTPEEEAHVGALLRL